MANGHTRSPIRKIENLYRLGVTRDLNDAQLLNRFVTGSQEVAEAAFSAIVERHGSMVRGVCRPILGPCQTVDDAFEATFLVLVRKARSMRNQDRLSGWLYGVDLRTAKYARHQRLRRGARELRLVQDVLESTSNSRRETEIADLRSALDEEISRLPRRFREALLLCELEGRSCAEAAGQLGIPEGTLSSRLARARSLLRSPLAHRGLAPVSAGVFASFVSNEVHAEAIPTALLRATTQVSLGWTVRSSASGAIAVPVFTLTKGVLHAMFMSKIKILGMVADESLTCVIVGSTSRPRAPRAS